MDSDPRKSIVFRYESVSALKQFQNYLCQHDSSCDQFQLHRNGSCLTVPQVFVYLLQDLAILQQNSPIKLVLCQLSEVHLQQHCQAVGSKQVVGRVCVIGGEAVLSVDVEELLDIAGWKKAIMRVMGVGRGQEELIGEGGEFFGFFLDGFDVLGEESQHSWWIVYQNITIMAENGAKAKLIEQHIKLKSQLKELASKMDEIAEKERERKKKKQTATQMEEDERVVELKKELKEQEIRIQKNKAEITKLRRNLDSKYDINKIVEKENELKHLKGQLKALEEEKQSLEKIRKAQEKALKSNEDRETANKISRMEEELKQLTQKTKKQVESINEKEKQIRKLHEQYIIKEEKVRQIQTKLKEKKPHSEEVNEQMIAQLEEEVKQLENQRAEIEKEGNEKIRGLERERKELKSQLERKKLILEEKEKELRLNQLKHKEILRLVNSGQEENKEKENKEEKRVVNKRGREAPKIEGDDDDIIEENPQPKAPGKLKKDKKEYGFSAKRDD